MNWGNKLLITFLVFGSGMGYLVYRSMSTSFELVEKDYYKTELQHQSTIDAAHRFHALRKEVKLVEGGHGLRIELPANEKGAVTEASIWFYCAYQAALDRKFQLKAEDNGVLTIPRGELAPVNYTIKMDWKAGGQEFYTEKQVSIRP